MNRAMMQGEMDDYTSAMGKYRRDVLSFNAAVKDAKSGTPYITGKNVTNGGNDDGLFFKPLSAAGDVQRTDNGDGTATLSYKTANTSGEGGVFIDKSITAPVFPSQPALPVQPDYTASQVRQAGVPTLTEAARNANSRLSQAPSLTGTDKGMLQRILEGKV